MCKRSALTSIPITLYAIIMGILIGAAIAAGSQFSGLHGDVRLIVPVETVVRQGEVAEANLLVRHDGGATCASPDRFSIKLADEKNRMCNSDETICARISSEATITLNAGEQGSFVIEVRAARNAPLSTGSIYHDMAVPVNVTCGNNVYDASAFTVYVKERGWFRRLLDRLTSLF